MKTIGEKIKQLRLSIAMSQHDLAESLEVTEKTVQRYETNKSRPNSYTLAILASFFDVSSDYLLGLHGLADGKTEEKYKINKQNTYNYFYDHYLKCKHEYTIVADSIYYWIYASEKEIGGQTMWKNWGDDSHSFQIRELRPIDPYESIKQCKLVYGQPMVLNSETDVAVFRIFGGQAIVRDKICIRYLPEYLNDFIAEII